MLGVINLNFCASITQLGFQNLNHEPKLGPERVELHGPDAGIGGKAASIAHSKHCIKPTKLSSSLCKTPKEEKAEESGQRQRLRQSAIVAEPVRKVQRHAREQPRQQVDSEAWL